MGVGAVINLAVSVALPASVVGNIAPIVIYNFGMALVTPCISIKLLDAFPLARGSVSALQSSTHVAMMAVTSALVVPFAQQSLVRFASVMLASVFVGAIIWKIYLATHPAESSPLSSTA
jgi:hypothetical protein